MAAPVAAPPAATRLAGRILRCFTMEDHIVSPDIMARGGPLQKRLRAEGERTVAKLQALFLVRDVDVWVLLLEAFVLLHGQHKELWVKLGAETHRNLNSFCVSAQLVSLPSPFFPRPALLIQTMFPPHAPSRLPHSQIALRPVDARAGTGVAE